MPAPVAFPQYAAPPMPMPAPRPAPPQPVRPAAPAPVAAPRPVARGNDTPAPPPPLPPLRLPKPAALGIAAAVASEVAVDWADVRGRMERLGAVGFAFEKTAAGLFRVTCLMPTAVPDAPHRIGAEADSEGEAVRLALSRVDEWLRGK